MTHVLTFYFPLVRAVSPGEAAGGLLKASGAPENVPESKPGSLKLLLPILPPWFRVHMLSFTPCVRSLVTSNPEPAASKREQQATVKVFFFVGFVCPSLPFDLSFVRPWGE